MNKDLKIYIPLINFLATVLGKDTEVVLQDFTNGFDHSLVYIKNNLSNREIGSPATDFVLDIVRNKIYIESDYLVNYRSRTHSGKNLYSSSYFIKDELNELVGMICINSDKSKMISLKKLFESGISIIDENLLGDGDNDKTSADETIVENFNHSVDSLIDDLIFKETNGKDLSQYKLSKSEKISIVQVLDTKGFFEFKDSISKVASIFQMSEVSIYKYKKSERVNKIIEE